MKNLKISKSMDRRRHLGHCRHSSLAVVSVKSRSRTPVSRKKPYSRRCKAASPPRAPSSPLTSVTVGTQVSGIVSKLYVDYNSVVKKGQVIAELDKTNLLSQLHSAKATLSSNQSNLDYQTANYKRYQTLYKKGLVSADVTSAAFRLPSGFREQASAQEEVQRADQSGLCHHHRPSTVWCSQECGGRGQTVAASSSRPKLFTI